MEKKTVKQPKEYEDRHQAHGKSVKEMEELQYQQVNEPGEIEMIPGNNAGDNITDKYFKEAYSDYKLPAHEDHIYHVAMEARSFAPGGAEPVKNSVSAVKKFTPEAYEFMKKNNSFVGYITHLLHNPELNEKGAKRTKAAKEEKSDRDGEDRFPTIEELEDMSVFALRELYTSYTDTTLPANLKKADVIAELEKVVEEKRASQQK